jgi:hypothetical protein
MRLWLNWTRRVRFDHRGGRRWFSKTAISSKKLPKNVDLLPIIDFGIRRIAGGKGQQPLNSAEFHS